MKTNGGTSLSQVIGNIPHLAPRFNTNVAFDPKFFKTDRSVVRDSGIIGRKIGKSGEIRSKKMAKASE
jgi:hypothetical protein